MSAPEDQQAVPARPASRSRELLRLLEAIGPFLGLLLIFSFFALYDTLEDGTFWTEEDPFSSLLSMYNLKLVAAQTTIVALAALGMTIIIVSAGIDLSPGSAIALTTVVVALCLAQDPQGSILGSIVTRPLLAALAGVSAAALVGFVNGVHINGLRIVPFIVTLGMMGVARGLAKLLAGEQKINAPETWLNGLLAVDPDPQSPWWHLPFGVVVLAVFAFLVFFLLRSSVFGRYVFAIGSSEATARLCGVRVPFQKICIYTLGGALTGIAGVMQFSQLTVGDPTVAGGKELDIIASVVIGGGSLSGGKGGVPGTILGAFLMGILRNGCDIYGIPNYVQEIFIGIIIVAAVALDQLRQRL